MQRRVPCGRSLKGWRETSRDWKNLRSHRFTQTLHDRFDDVVGLHRLADDACRMEVRNRFWRVGDDDDRDIPDARCDLLTNREAVHVGEDEIQHDGINRKELFEDGHGFEPVPRLSGREPRQSQGQTQQPSKIVVFFDDQDGFGADGHSWTAIPSRAALH